MAKLPLPPSDEAIRELQEQGMERLGIRPCVWQAKVALHLLSKLSMVSISATGSGKTITFWLPMMREKGLTLIITPLKTLGHQIAMESCHLNFPAVSITAELLGENTNLVQVIILGRPLRIGSSLFCIENPFRCIPYSSNVP